MNATNNQTRQCDPVDIYGPEELEEFTIWLWVAVAHCYCVTVFGTLGNAVALWCVVKCTKTWRPVKILVCSVIVPALLLSLVTSVIGEWVIACLTCDPHRISRMALIIIIGMFNILFQIELASIAAVAVVRAVSVCAPQKQNLGLRGAVLLVTGICLYSILTGIAVGGNTIIGEADHLRIFFFLNTTLLALITAGAYLCMMLVIQRNKRRLAASQHQEREATTTTMDQVTRAIWVVFMSNMMLSLPHSIYHLMGKQPPNINAIIHVLFYTHNIVDPLVLVWFNSCYRSRVHSLVMQFVSRFQQCLSSTRGPSNTTTTPTTNNNLTGQSNPVHIGEA